jgi:WhiB family redox-sensing transcriptional regulator
MTIQNIAACADDPDAMFDTGTDADERNRLVCDRCPIKESCLERALDQRERFGMWGGHTPEERSAIIRQRGEPTPVRHVLIGHVEAGVEPFNELTRAEQIHMYLAHEASGQPPHTFARRHHLSGATLHQLRAEAAQAQHALAA